MKALGIIAVCISLYPVIMISSGINAGEVLIYFHSGFDFKTLETSNSIVKVSGSALRIIPVTSNEECSVTLNAPEGRWDFSRHRFFMIDFKNVGSEKVKVSCTLISPTAVYKNKPLSRSLRIEPGARDTLKIPLPILSGYDAEGNEIQLVGMRTTPWGQTTRRWMKKIDPENVTGCTISLTEFSSAAGIEISSVRLAGANVWKTKDNAPLFPFVDTFGQYIHKEWPGKTHDIRDMKKKKIDEEAADLKAHPGPTDWNQYGGWKKGPTLEATGHFRVDKYNGKWWLVDPEGKLFFSHGICGVRFNGEYTSLRGREHYFQWLPAYDDQQFTSFLFGKKTQVGQLAGKKLFSIAFDNINLSRKYGENWQFISREIAHRRLRSWGLNTLGAWSAPEVHLMLKTPYTIAINYPFDNRLRVGNNPQDRFPDVFDPNFEKAIRKALPKYVKDTMNDPWCLGYFVNNELKWEQDVIPRGALTALAHQPAKKVFVDMLKDKYRSIENLNKIWGTYHTSWNVLLNVTKEPDDRKARADYEEFITLVAEKYFSTVRKTLKEYAPDKLYLGCRFNHYSKPPAVIATRYCDVVSYNAYLRPEEIENFQFPGETDVPLIVGEWHFCALDRGNFDFGMQQAENQQDRALLYENYVKAMLKHPQFVGCHWFCYKDQPVTGRVQDGANAQNGFLDIADTPYYETITACRKVGQNLYLYRLNED